MRSSPSTVADRLGMLHRGVAAAVLVAAAACAGVPPREQGSGQIGKPLALSAPDLQGREVDLAAGHGKVRVIDFWATWCEPCKEAMPDLDRLSQELATRGLEVYGVTVDEDRTQVLRFLEEHPVRFPILWDKGATRLSALDITAMPVTMIVDRRGVVRHVHQGWSERRARRQREEIEQLLREP